MTLISYVKHYSPEAELNIIMDIWIYTCIT